MNFSSFGGQFSSAFPTIHQFAAKFSQEDTNNVCSQDNISNKYAGNGIPSFSQHHSTAQDQVINTTKYQGNYMNQNAYSQQITLRQDKRLNYEHQEVTTQELCTTNLQQNNDKTKQELQESDCRNQRNQFHEAQNQAITTSMPSSWQSLATPGSTVADYLSQLPASTLPLSLHHFLKYSAETMKLENSQINIQNSDSNLNLLHNDTTPNMLTTNSIHPINNLNTLSTINVVQIHNNSPLSKKKKKKKAEKERKARPKPGEIRLTTALDGSTLYCCPECHMAYPEKELLEQHLVGHTLERRFVCDICGAGLKRKDHLTRHKQSHNPERPYVCTVCLKAFKRKEQLTLHFVIHSGEKRHVCTECGKGFYRKDHLRKHTRSHIARRVKVELSQQGNTPHASLQIQAAASNSTSNILVNQSILS